MCIEFRKAQEVLGSYTLHRKPVRRYGPLRLSRQSTHGDKVTMDFVARFDSKMEHRVFCCLNGDNLYIIRGGEILFLGAHEESDIRPY